MTHTISRTFVFGFVFLLALSSPLSLPRAQAEELRFAKACERGESIILAAVGDVLLHGPLQKQAYSSKDTFGSLWRGIEDLIADADLAYANLEGPAAFGVVAGGRVAKDPGMIFDKRVYSGYPMFNYHPIISWDLKKAGFDVVSTANNHTMDRGPLGVDRTMESLEAAGLPFTGTRTKAQAQSGEPMKWHVVTEKNGFRVAWLACTFSTNGVSDPFRQVLGCFRDADQIETEIKALAGDATIDAVILTPHWGEAEYTHKVETSQRTLGKRFLEAGATAIFGNHPHVTKPWEKVITKDGRETFVIYSIGNFVSNQQSLAQKSSAIVYLGLTKRAGEKAWINGVTYVPTYMLAGPYEIVATDRNPRAPKAATQLIDRLLDPSRKIDSRKRIETNPECYQ